MRAEVARCNGPEVTTSGDGFFARFDSPAHAVEAARAAREAMTALDPPVCAAIGIGLRTLPRVVTQTINLLR